MYLFLNNCSSEAATLVSEINYTYIYMEKIKMGFKWDLSKSAFFSCPLMHEVTFR